MAVEDSDNARRRHDMLSSLAEASADHLAKNQGMEIEAAIEMGNAVADFVASHYAGQHVYFVKDEAFHLDARDRKICAEMERGKAVEVAAKYGLSYVRVHQIFRRYLAELRARAAAAQGDMFGERGGAAINEDNLGTVSDLSTGVPRPLGAPLETTRSLENQGGQNAHLGVAHRGGR